jgi:hypothetical protein
VLLKSHSLRDVVSSLDLCFLECGVDHWTHRNIFVTLLESSAALSCLHFADVISATDFVGVTGSPMLLRVRRFK